VETKRAAEQIEDFLYRSQVAATSIHGDRSQREREHALAAFRRGTPSILVATDVAARGLDVPDCMHVINYELPRDINSYVHRIGRTGRMGRHGTAISLFSYSNKPVARDMVTLLQEAAQACPEWLLKLAAEGGGGSKSYSGRSKFGGRDFRQNAQVRQYRHNGSSFPMGGQMDGGPRGMHAGGGLYGPGGFMAGMPSAKGGGLYAPNGMAMGGGDYGMYSQMGMGGMAAGGGNGGYQQQMGGGGGGRNDGQQWMGPQAQYYAQYGPQGGTGGADGSNGIMPGLMWPQQGMPPPSAGAMPSGSPSQYVQQAAYGAGPLQ